MRQGAPIYMAKAENSELEITREVECDLKGFEHIRITFNLLATPAQVDNFIRQMGARDSHTCVVVKVDNWPKDEYGPDPFDLQRVPGIWLAWLARKGWGKATREYLDDPNSSTA